MKRSTRARGGGGDAEKSKPELGTLRELLDEGSGMQNDQMRGQMGAIAEVVETAAEWQKRVREALEVSDTSSL